jgi:hypothetical protein
MRRTQPNGVPTDGRGKGGRQSRMPATIASLGDDNRSRTALSSSYATGGYEARHLSSSSSRGIGPTAGAKRSTKPTVVSPTTSTTTIEPIAPATPTAYLNLHAVIQQQPPPKSASTSVQSPSQRHYQSSTQLSAPQSSRMSQQPSSLSSSQTPRRTTASTITETPLSPSHVLHNDRPRLLIEQKKYRSSVSYAHQESLPPAGVKYATIHPSPRPRICHAFTNNRGEARERWLQPASTGVRDPIIISQSQWEPIPRDKLIARAHNEFEFLHRPDPLAATSHTFGHIMDHNPANNPTNNGESSRSEAAAATPVRGSYSAPQLSSILSSVLNHPLPPVGPNGEDIVRPLARKPPSLKRTCDILLSRFLL